LLANVRGQPACVAGLGEPHGSEIFLSGCLPSGISNKRLWPEGGKDNLGLSLGRGRIKDLWTYAFLLFLKIVSRAKPPSSQRTLESKVFLFFFYLPNVLVMATPLAGASVDRGVEVEIT